jgi:hypothetical protein
MPLKVVKTLMPLIAEVELFIWSKLASGMMRGNVFADCTVSMKD